jgi:hypothetical protein
MAAWPLRCPLRASRPAPALRRDCVRGWAVRTAASYRRRNRRRERAPSVAEALLRSFGKRLDYSGTPEDRGDLGEEARCWLVAR